MLVLPDYSLAACNTLAVPASARAYISVSSDADVVEALALAVEHQWPLLPLGGGSNIVLAGDFSGAVLHLGLRGIEQVGDDSEHVYVRAAAGENWHAFVQHCLAHQWWGLENLSLIPGTVGAAPIQNIGAYGVELEEVFHELVAIDVASGLPVTFTREACEFSYRHSIFKGRLQDRYIITQVTFRLPKAPALNLSYPALKMLTDQVQPRALTPQTVSDLVCQIRRQKLPDPAVIPNVGSFFKNPVVDAARFVSLQQAHPDIVAYPQPAGVKLAAGWLIDRAGWRGYEEGGVAVHAEQALVITNPGRRSGRAVLALAERIAHSVTEAFGVALEIEPRIY